MWHGLWCSSRFALTSYIGSGSLVEFLHGVVDEPCKCSYACVKELSCTGIVSTLVAREVVSLLQSRCVWQTANDGPEISWVLSSDGKSSSSPKIAKVLPGLQSTAGCPAASTGKREMGRRVQRHLCTTLYGPPGFLVSLSTNPKGGQSQFLLVCL